MSEKTEKATPYKLQKAREKGQVSKSAELTSCLSFMVLLGMLTALWPKTLNQIQNMMHHLLYLAAHMQFSQDNIHQLQQFILTQLMNLWLPFALAGGLAVILVSMAQSGIVWSATPLIPDLKRFNMIQGFKKIFSLKTCFETAKSTIKLIAAFTFLLFTLQHQIAHILQLILTSPAQYPEYIMHFLLKTMFQLLLILFLLAIIDKGYTQWKYAKDQKMSKQEIKEEHKQREGDPKIKSKIRQLQQQLRQKTGSLNQVKTADVVITNPTHLAVALKYDKNTMPSPKVVCKAQGEMVVQVKKLARKYSIPMIENKSFARMLHHSVALNHWIGKELYPVAASVFRELYARRKGL